MQVLMVSFTTRRGDGPDLTCVIGSNECPLVAHDSCVYYAKAQVTTARDLCSLIEGGHIQLSDVVPPGALRKIREGFGRSKQAPRAAMEVAKSQEFFRP